MSLVRSLFLYFVRSFGMSVGRFFFMYECMCLLRVVVRYLVIAGLCCYFVT